MALINRRKFIYSSALIPVITGVVSSFGRDSGVKTAVASKNISLGVISAADNPEEDLKIVRDLGFPTCQLNVKSYSPELAGRISSTVEKYRLKVSSMVCMGPGIYRYNFTEGPSTIGLVPRENRAARVERLFHGIDFCKAAGIPAVMAHFGFIPENPKDVALY